MEKGLQNGLKCILRDIDFKKFPGGAPPDPPSYEQGLPHPEAHGLRRSVQVFGLKCPPVNDPSGSSPEVSCPLSLPLLKIPNCQSVLKFLSLHCKLFIFA